MSRPHNPTLQELEALLYDVEDILDKQPFLLDIEMPSATIVGDIHGHWEHYQKALSLREGGVIFLGDVVDRGPYQIEVVADIFRMMIREEGEVFFLRGNHESREMNTKWGFRKELHKRYDEDGEYIWEKISTAFDKLPICALLNRNYFLVHGGVTEAYPSVGKIRRRGSEKTLRPEDMGLLWNDPGGQRQIYPYVHNDYRSREKYFSNKVAEDFCASSGVDAIIRGHQCVHEGFEWNYNKRVLTVFSIPEYRNANLGAVAIVHGKQVETRTFY